MKLIAGTTGDLLFVCASVYQITKRRASILRFNKIKKKRASKPQGLFILEDQVQVLPARVLAALHISDTPLLCSSLLTSLLILLPHSSTPPSLEVFSLPSPAICLLCKSRL